MSSGARRHARKEPAMILALDIGNTNITFGGMLDGKAVFRAKLGVNKNRTPDEYAMTLRLVAEAKGADLRQASGCIISCVVPELTGIIAEAARLVTGKSPLILGPGVKTGLNIKIDDPNGLGGDFVAAAVAAAHDYELPCVMVHMGTATALSVLDARGNYLGGAICPGVMTSQSALAAQTSLLKYVSLERPAKVIGRSTEESLKSGLVVGTAAMVDGLIARFEAELGEIKTVIATGEWAEAVVPACLRPGIIVDDELLLRGLYMIYAKNRRI